MKIVMLDGDTLPVPLPTDQQQADWEMRAQTPADDIVSSLAGATVAITNKVPLRLTHCNNCLNCVLSVSQRRAMTVSILMLVAHAASWSVMFQAIQLRAFQRR